jgi:hypothetical protein
MALPHIDYHAVLEAVQHHTETCPLCAAIEQAENAFWESVLFSQVGTEGFQDQFLGTNGFCGRHARDFAARRDGTAVTMLYVPLMRHRRRWIDESRGSSLLRLILRRLTGRPRKEHPAIRSGRRAGPQDCLLCNRIDHWGDQFLINLLRHQHDGAVRAAVETGAGLCVPHYRRLHELGGRNRLIGLLPGGPGRVPPAASWIAAHHERRWDALVTEAEAAAHSRGATVWKRLIRTMEGGSNWP